MKKIILILLTVSLFGCTDEYNAERVLKSSGYSNIEMTGYRFFACGRDDFYHTGFTAKSITDTPVSGVVCSGIFKLYTIRTD